jgi:hypothetical protein
LPSWAEARAAKAARWLRTRLEETIMLGFRQVNVSLV